MYAMRMAAFALGLLAAGTAVAQTAQAPSTTTPPADQQQQQQQQTMPPGGGPGMGMGMGRGMGPGGQHMGGQHMGGRHMGGGHHMMKGGPGRGDCGPQQAAVEATPETVKARLEQRLQRMNNPRLKIGEVTKQGDGTILATIVTVKENAVVDKFVVDPKTHSRKRID